MRRWRPMSGRRSPSAMTRATSPKSGRIASPEMLPRQGLLPHLICCPPKLSGGVKDEAGQHGNRDELVTAIAERYSRSDRRERGRILDEFVAVTGFHRKHAARLLAGGQTGRRSGAGPSRRVYEEAVREAL